MSLNYKNMKKELEDDEVAGYIDSIGLRINDIEADLSNMSLNVSRKDKDESIEKRLNPPPLIVAFYGYIKSFQKIPSQQEYIDYYYLMNSKWIQLNVPPVKDSAFIGR